MTSTQKIVDIVHSLAERKEENGRIEDQHGNLIKLETFKEYELQRDQLTRSLCRDCAVIADEIHALKAKMAKLIDNHIQQMGSLYNINLGGKKGNLSLTTIDKKLKVERSRQDRKTTNEHMLVAIELIQACVQKWKKGANQNLQAFVERYLRTDGKGSYNIADLQQLQKMKLKHPDEDWDNAMQALANAIEFDFTAEYFRAFYRDESGQYHQIPLDIAKA